MACALVCATEAQTNVQLFHDFGRQYATTTFEMFKGDAWGDTFFFIDHYYATSDDRQNGLGSAFQGSYFEIERALNFWKDTRLCDLSLHVEYDATTWGRGMACIGARYAFHNASFSRTASVALMYDHFIGPWDADLPLKFTAVWGLTDLFGLRGCTLSGFLDVWGNNTTFNTNPLSPHTEHFSVLSEPQLWWGLASIGIPNLHLGGEVELSYNYAGHDGFMCNPCLGLKWAF